MTTPKDTAEQLPSSFTDGSPIPYMGPLCVKVLPADTPVVRGVPADEAVAEKLNRRIGALEAAGLADGIRAQFAKVLDSNGFSVIAQNPAALMVLSVFAEIVETLAARVSEVEAEREDVKLKLQGAVKRIAATTERLTAIEGQNSELAQAAFTDTLTGLSNRAGFEKNGGDLFEYQRKVDKPLSCAFLDLDHFKYINDTYGHAAGDYIIHEVANILKEQSRFSDGRPARIGGEELVILLPDTDLYGAGVFIERLRRAIQNHQFVYEGKAIKVTASIGAAQANFNDKSETLESLRSRADRAMYHAKQQTGRNSAVTFGNHGDGEMAYKSLSPESRYRPPIPDGYVKAESDTIPVEGPKISPES